MNAADFTDDRLAMPDLRYWLWVLRRRFWLFAFVAATVAAAGLGAALLLPPVYEARAALLVESQQIPTALVRSTVNASASEQIEVIKQRLLTRETLLELAETHGVFAEAGPLAAAERADRMRAAIRFEQRILGARGRARPGDTVSTAIMISFRGDSGVRAAAVVNDLVARVLSQSAELRRSRAATTSDYFRQEVARLGDELGRMEGRIVAFQAENAEALPESLDYRRNQLGLLQERMQRFTLARIDLEQERAAIQIALGEGVGPLDPGAAAPSESARELAALRRTMVQRRAILTDDHPDIRALELRIRATEAAVAAEFEAAAGAAAAAAGSAAPTRLDPVLRELRGRLALVEARIAFNDEVIAELERERAALAQSLAVTPGVQMDLATLQRTLDGLEARYRVARDKLAEAEAGEQLEDRQQGERFELIERATAPADPVAPNRRAWAALGLGGGVGGGLALIVLLELMGGVVRRPEDLARIGHEPAAVIPWIQTAAERRWMWFRRIVFLAVAAGGGAAGLWALHTRYLPLETIWGELLDASGLAGALEMVGRGFGG